MSEFKIVRKRTIDLEDGSKICWDELCDEYGMTLRIIISHFDKDDNLVREPVELYGL